jgi:hypothetical protein
MKHNLRGFLARLGYFQPQGLAFVELRRASRFAWSAGRFPNGGMVHPRRDLDACSPIVHSQPIGLNVTPCPAE